MIAYNRASHQSAHHGNRSIRGHSRVHILYHLMADICISGIQASHGHDEILVVKELQVKGTSPCFNNGLHHQPVTQYRFMTLDFPGHDLDQLGQLSLLR